MGSATDAEPVHRRTPVHDPGRELSDTSEPTAGPEPVGGVLIAFEGGDGAGKSTQIALLEQALLDRGLAVVVTRQPGATALGAAIRELVLHGDDMDPRAEALLYAADKAQHVEQVVRPALARGAVVLTDRYVDSSIAYQGAGRALGATEVRDLQHWAVDGVLPDLTVLLDVSAETGRARRGDIHDRLEAEADSFHERVREHFLELADAAPGRYVVLDAAADPARIAAAVLTAVDALLEQTGAASAR